MSKNHTQKLKFQFESDLEYQKRAIESIVDIFEGQEITRSRFSIVKNLETKAQANQAIFEYIEVYYNRQRMHSANGNLSPVEFEEKMMLQFETAA